MGTYFALMDEAAKRADEYQDLDHIRDILLNAQKGIAKREEISKVIEQLSEWKLRVKKLFTTDGSPESARAREALARLEGLKSDLEAFLNVAHR